MNKKNILVLLSSLVLASCVGTNPSISESRETPDEPLTLTIGTTTKIENAVRDEYNFDLLSSATSEVPLVSKSKEGEYSSPFVDYVTDDAKTWTFTLKDDFKWSDGVMMTAYDIVYSLKYEGTVEKPTFSSEEKKGTYASYTLSEDKKSVTLMLEEANIRLLDNFTTFRVRPAHIYEGKTQLSDDDKRVSFGPYQFLSYNENASTITFVPNANYPVTPKYDSITYKLFQNDDALYHSLTSGDVDMVWNYSNGVPVTYQKELKKNNDIILTTLESSACPAMLTFNNKKGLFANEDIRKAVSYALDYNQFKTAFGSEYAKTPNRSFAPSSLFGFKETETLVTNKTEANSHMEKAGYHLDNGKYKKDGKEALFTLTVNSSKAAHLSYADYVKNQLDAFGITVNLETLDSTNYNAKTSNKFSNGNITMEAAIYGYTAFGMSDFGAKYINGNHAVQGGAQVFDETFNAYNSALDNATSLEAYTKAAGYIQDYYALHIPAIALYWDSQILAYRSVNSLTPNVDATFGLNNVLNTL